MLKLIIDERMLHIKYFKMNIYAVRCVFVVDMFSWVTLVWKRRPEKQLMMRDGYTLEMLVEWIKYVTLSIYCSVSI